MVRQSYIQDARFLKVKGHVISGPASQEGGWGMRNRKKKYDDFFVGTWNGVLDGEIQPLFEDASAVVCRWSDIIFHGDKPFLILVVSFRDWIWDFLPWSWRQHVSEETCCLQLQGRSWYASCNSVYLFILLHKLVLSHADYNLTVIFWTYEYWPSRKVAGSIPDGDDDIYLTAIG